MRPWSRNTKTIVIVLYLAAVLALLIAARPLLVPVAIAALVAYLLSPLVRLITLRTGLRRPRAVAAAYIFFLLVIIAIPSSFTSLIVRQVNRVDDDVDSILQAVESFVEQPIVLGPLILDPPRETILDLEQEIRTVVSQGSARVINALSGLGTNLVWIIIFFVTTYYLLRDGPRLREAFLRRLPEPLRTDADRLLREIDSVWGNYLRGQVILAAIIGVLTWLSMAAVGLRGALVIGIIAGVLDLIPSLGPLVGGLISIGVALILGSTSIDVSNLWFALIVGGIFFLIQQFENIWLAPKILGDRLRLHPAVVVTGVLGALALTGIIGAFVVIPIIASLSVLNRYLYARLTDRDPWPASEAKPDKPPDLAAEPLPDPESS